MLQDILRGQSCKGIESEKENQPRYFSAWDPKGAGLLFMGLLRSLLSCPVDLS